MNEGYLSIDKAIEKLGLANAPKGVALNTIVNWANYEDGISIYFDGALCGAEFYGEPDPQFNSDGELIQLLIAVGNVAEMPGRNRLLGISLMQLDGRSFVVANRFVVGGALYHCSDETGMYVDEVIVSLDDIYVLSEELNEFIQKASQIEVVKVRQEGSEPGLRKAFALLAREKAEHSAKFRTGDKVNSAAIKKHIIDLAKRYHVSTGLLAKIDDKLSATLNELDIREIKESN